MGGITSLVEDLITYQERPCTMELISRLNFIYLFFFKFDHADCSKITFFQVSSTLPSCNVETSSFISLFGLHSHTLFIATGTWKLFAFLSSARHIGKDRILYCFLFVQVIHTVYYSPSFTAHACTFLFILVANVNFIVYNKPKVKYMHSSQQIKPNNKKSFNWHA